MTSQKQFTKTIISALIVGFKEARVQAAAKSEPEHIGRSAATVARTLGNLDWADDEDFRDATELAANIADEVDARGYSKWAAVESTNLTNDLQKIVDGITV